MTNIYDEGGGVVATIGPVTDKYIIERWNELEEKGLDPNTIWDKVCKELDVPEFRVFRLFHDKLLLEE